jgi:hypothetical protein
MLAVSTGMANRKASIWMYVKVGDRWRHVKPVEGRNHKLKPGYALIDGAEQHHPDAAYYIRFREGSVAASSTPHCILAGCSMNVM